MFDETIISGTIDGGLGAGRALPLASPVLALIAATAFLPSVALAGETGDSGDRPSKVIMPRESSGPTLSDIVSPPPPVRKLAGTPASDGGPVESPAAAEGDPNALYGPPAPKVEHGELAEIDWNKAPDIVPPALEEAILLVTAKYPTALAARSGLRAAASDVKAAQWLRFPAISGNLAYLDSSGSPQPQVVVEAPIWTGGRISSSIRRAKAQETASSAQYIEVVQDLAVTVTNTYFEIVRQTQSEQLLAESVDVHRQLVETMERRVKQEVSPVADLELARSRLAQIEQQYTVTKSQRATALRILAELVADPSYDLGPVPYYDPEADLPSRDVLEEQSVSYDPTLRRLNAEAQVAKAEVEQTRSGILPQLNAQYSYDNVFGSRVGVVVRAQSQGGLSQFSQVNAARQRVDASLEQIRTVEQQLRRDVAADIITYESAKARAAISRDATDTASRVSASYMRQFIAGRRSWLDVMNALREAVTAQLGRADAEVQVMATATRLLLRSGRWHPYFERDGNSAGGDRGEPGEPRDTDAPSMGR